MTASLVLVLDQLAKAAIRGSLALDRSLDVIPGLLEIVHVRNTGGAFGLLPGRRELFIAVSLLMICAVAIYWWRERPTAWPVAIALGLIVGGALGNLVDRAIVGQVTDFLSVSFFAPVFNIADSAIVVGVGLLVVWILFGHREEPVSAEENAPVADEAKVPDGGEGGRPDAEQRERPGTAGGR